MNPEYIFKFYTDTEIDDYMRIHFADHPIYGVYCNSKFGPLRTDIWRYCLMLNEGGVYCDIGKAIDTPISSIVSQDAQLVVSWERRNPQPVVANDIAQVVLAHPNRRMINWLLISAPGNPLFKLAVEDLVTKYATVRGKSFQDPKQAILEFSGPIHLTECLHKLTMREDWKNIQQAGIEFYGHAIWELPGSYVRYIGRPAYSLATNHIIVE